MSTDNLHGHIRAGFAGMAGHAPAAPAAWQPATPFETRAPRRAVQPDVQGHLAGAPG